MKLNGSKDSSISTVRPAGIEQTDMQSLRNIFSGSTKKSTSRKAKTSIMSNVSFFLKLWIHITFYDWMFFSFTCSAVSIISHGEKGRNDSHRHLLRILNAGNISLVSWKLNLSDF